MHCIQVGLVRLLLCVPRERPFLEVVWVQSSSAACILTVRGLQRARRDDRRGLRGLPSVGRCLSICIDCMELLHLPWLGMMELSSQSFGCRCLRVRLQGPMGRGCRQGELPATGFSRPYLHPSDSDKWSLLLVSCLVG